MHSTVVVVCLMGLRLSQAQEQLDQPRGTSGHRTPSGLDRYLRDEAPHALRIAADNVENPRLAAWLRDNAGSEHRTNGSQASPPPTRGLAALLRRALDIAHDEGAYRILGLPLALASESATRIGIAPDINEAMSLLSPEQRGDVRQLAHEFAELIHAALAEMRGGPAQVAR